MVPILIAGSSKGDALDREVQEVLELIGDPLDLEDDRSAADQAPTGSKQTKAKKTRNISKFVCPLCNLQVSFKTSLYRHIRMVHNTSPVEIPKDKDPGKKSSKVNDHFMIWRDPKSSMRVFQCTICKLKCREESEITAHINDRHGPYCLKCNRSFKNNLGLQVHLSKCSNV